MQYFGYYTYGSDHPSLYHLKMDYQALIEVLLLSELDALGML